MLKLGKRLLNQNGLILRQSASKACSIRILNRNYSNPSYEGEGKTNCKVLNNDMEMGLMVNSYSQVNIIQQQYLHHFHQGRFDFIMDFVFFFSAWFST